jgi:anaerobic carbon-monoxide dehydrogenase iron sulfur subunit
MVMTADRTRASGRLRVHPERCQGCQACVVACSLAHEGYVDPIHARLRVILDPLRAEHEVRICHQCRRAPCAAACPRGAISYTPTSRRPNGPSGGGTDGGYWTVDAAACDGCGLCVAACPFHVLMLGYDRDTIRICDTCGGAPECVASCPAGALVWEV